MNAMGIVRKVDELGRVVIPVELRRSLEIGERGALEVFTEEDKIILRKYAPGCLFCDEVRGSQLKQFKGKKICKNCISKLAEDTNLK